MATLIVPPVESDEEVRWASLGDGLAEWIEANTVWGPGSKFGQPVTVDEEFYAWLVRSYQVFPQGHEHAGRRRFDLCSEEKAKGTGKTEHAIVVGQAEINPHAPVRCVGWDNGRPIGGPVPYPLLRFLATSEDQVQRTAFGRFRQALKRSPHRELFHITIEKIVVLGEDGAAAGEAEPMAVSPDTVDGDLPTWQHVDEPHRWSKRRHRLTFEAIRENSLKDRTADSWMMTTSTAGDESEQSVERDLLRSAQKVLTGEQKDPSFFFFRRFAPPSLPLEDIDDVTAAVLEARGPAAEWSGDIRRIAANYFKPTTNKNYYRRVWLGHWLSGEGRAFNAESWRSGGDATRRIGDGAFVSLGFDGGYRRDSTALIATEIPTGFQQVVGIWARPENPHDDWHVDVGAVDDAVDASFERWDVWRMLADPAKWQDQLRAWEGRYGTERIIEYWTNSYSRMAVACKNYRDAIAQGVVPNDANATMAQHIENAHRFDLAQRIEDDDPPFVIVKARSDSLDFIDAGVAGVLSWEGRSQAIAAGAKPSKSKRRRVVAF